MDTTQGLDLTVLGGFGGEANYEQMLKDNNGSVNNGINFNDDGGEDEDNVLGGGFDEVDEDPQYNE